MMPDFSKIMQFMQMFPRFMQNPIGEMMSVGLNVPENIRNNPGAILNYLTNSGQMTQDQYNQASQFANMAKNLFGKKP